MLARALFAVLLFGVVSSSALSSSISSSRNLGYDPKADPFVQYHDAIAQAQAQNKLVLVIAGGDWCYWCHVLNKFVTRDADVAAALHDTFVVMKVYVGDENYNEFFFSQLPEARAAPYFWIIGQDRNVLSSQSTRSFELNKNSYDKREFLEFIGHWKQQLKPS